jgi:hypothetical protein
MRGVAGRPPTSDASPHRSDSCPTLRESACALLIAARRTEDEHERADLRVSGLRCCDATAGGPTVCFDAQMPTSNGSSRPLARDNKRLVLGALVLRRSGACGKHAGALSMWIRCPSADPLSSCAQKSLGTFATHLPQARGNCSDGTNHSSESSFGFRHRINTRRTTCASKSARVIARRASR